MDGGNDAAPEMLSKSWIVVDNEDETAENKAEGDAAEPVLNSGVEDIPAVEKELNNDSHLDSDTDSISIISESDGCSHNGKSDEEEMPEVMEAAPVTTQQIVSSDANEIEMLTSDYLKEKWKVKQLSIALAVVISSVILGYYIETTSHTKSNYRFEISPNDNFNSFVPVRRFDPYKKYGIKEAEYKKEAPKAEKAKTEKHAPPRYKNDKEEELKIKEIYLSEKEKFLIQKEHELVKREMEMREAEEAYEKATNEQRNQNDNYYKNKENSLKSEKEKRREDKTNRKQGHLREEKNLGKDNKNADKKARFKYEEDDDEPEEDSVSGKWYMNLHQARNNLRNKMDYPFIKKMKNKALWYFRWMFARESNRSNKRKFKFEI